MSIKQITDLPYMRLWRDSFTLISSLNTHDKGYLLECLIFYFNTGKVANVEDKGVKLVYDFLIGKFNEDLEKSIKISQKNSNNSCKRWNKREENNEKEIISDDYNTLVNQILDIQKDTWRGIGEFPKNAKISEIEQELKKFNKEDHILILNSIIKNNGNIRQGIKNYQDSNFDYPF